MTGANCSTRLVEVRGLMAHVLIVNVKCEVSDSKVRDDFAISFLADTSLIECRVCVVPCARGLVGVVSHVLLQ